MHQGARRRVLPRHCVPSRKCLPALCTAVHAHIIIWVHPDDVDDAARNIVAAILGQQHTNGTWTAAAGAGVLEQQLLHLVLTHQLHTCYPSLCSVKGTCKEHFPFAAQHERAPQFHEDSNRYTYFRPGDAHRNVVPYHPGILLAWGAHMNIQCVTSRAWSLYLLKYAVKANHLAQLSTDAGIAQRLGLTDATPEMLHLLATTVLAHPVSPCEVAMHMAEISMVEHSDPVTVIHTQPPELRTRIRTRGGLSIPHVDMYCARPVPLQHYTLVRYFTEFRVTKVRTRWPTACHYMHACHHCPAEQHVPTAPQEVLQSEHHGTDTFGNHLYKRPDDQPIRFSVYDPAANTEAFFYNVLLRHVAFRSEAELISAGYASRTYQEECWTRAIISDDADLQVCRMPCP